MRYKIALLKTDEGYSVSVPGLPGCWSQGITEEEALQNIQDAIQEYWPSAMTFWRVRSSAKWRSPRKTCRAFRVSTIRTPSGLCRRRDFGSRGRASTS